MAGRDLSLLQANVNHSTRGQDLFRQALVEWNIDVAVVAEPYLVLDKPNWLGDRDGSVAIVGGESSRGLSPLVQGVKGVGYVTALVGETVVVGVYLRPKVALADVERILGEIGTIIDRSRPGPVLVMGDFNAKHPAWGSPVTDPRGERLIEWAAEVDLLVLNKGSTLTCVREKGGSIVDISFATPDLARRVTNWRVLGVETLSDHRYIRFGVSASAEDRQRRPTGRAPPPLRWALRRLDRDAAMAASTAEAWSADSGGGPGPDDGADEGAEWFRGAMTRICDMAMPRARRPGPRRQSYWWSGEIEQLRRNCTAARRQYDRCRGRLQRLRRAGRSNARDDAVEASLYRVYRECKKTLQGAIARAKGHAWNELLETLEKDPWGRPYMIVRNKLASGAVPLTESLHPQLLGNIVAGLFPDTPGEVTIPQRPQEAVAPEWDDSLGVQEEELDRAVKRLRAKNTAPGPDGVPGRVLALALGVLGDRFRQLLTDCLKAGRFPKPWKIGRLVLLRKAGRPAESPSAYRPICLLDEAGKLFERIIADRLVEHLSREGPDLADCQFGFRGGRSTTDAILRVKTLTDQAVSRGGVALAVSFDIQNAFNTLPWESVERALEYHRVPLYMREVMRDYFRDRWVSYRGRYEDLRREIRCGVPQGSVLGPLLWNLAYDWVLRGALFTGLEVVCYADDTLLVARGDTWEQAAARARAGARVIVGRIRMLGLQVALQKTEALWFHGPRRRPPGTQLDVGGVRIQVGAKMKYLGLILDSRWSFTEHVRSLAPRLRREIGNLRRLLPNLGGPSEGRRRLYEGVVRSIALYAAPAWHGALTAASINLLHSVQRVVAVRVMRGYRTIPHEAACALAGTPPWYLVAGAYASVYQWRVGLRSRGFVTRGPAYTRALGKVKLQSRQSLFEAWEGRLADATKGRRAVEAVRPVLKEWVERRQCGLSFRLAQVLSGHGCFGEYLCNKTGREATTACHECGHAEDTAQHTLEACPVWGEPRRVLRGTLGEDLSLPVIVRKMVDSEEAWEAMASFCEQVMSQKEANERERETAPDAPAHRRRRTGVRRRAYARQP